MAVSHRISGPIGVFGTYTSLKDADGAANQERKSSNSSSSDSGRGSRHKNASGDSNATLFDDDTTELDSSDEEMLMHWRNMRGAVRIQLQEEEEEQQEIGNSKRRRKKRRRGSCCDSQWLVCYKTYLN